MALFPDGGRFFTSDLTFLPEHLGNWNNKAAQRVRILNASHKQDLTYTIFASNFLKLRGQEHLKKKKKKEIIISAKPS